MEKQPYFKIDCGPNQGGIIKIPGESILIGRHSSCDYVIRNERISRHHIRVFCRDGRWMIEDLLSRNHTRLNGEELVSEKPQFLSNGDEIQLAAQIVLRFCDPESTINDENRVLRDGLWVDVHHHEIYIHNKRLDPKLSLGSFKILSLLYEKSLTNSPVVSIEEIQSVGWQNMEFINLDMVDAEISRLRKRLKELEPDHEFIQTVRKVGKRFVQFSTNK